MNNILFTICARAGSKGLKNKNISDFLGKPLCYQTLSVYDAFRKKHAEHNYHLALNTDSLELIEQVKSYNIPFEYVERTPELSGDFVSKLDVIRDTYRKVEGDFDFAIDLDLTSPLRTVDDVYGVLDLALKNESADGAFSVTDARRSPYFNQVQKNEDGFYYPVINYGAIARQQVPEVFDMNASIYVYRSSFLKKVNKQLFEGKMLVYIMRDNGVLDIDCQRDKDLMEIVANYLSNE
ncbi:MAG: acylneuraminate cytidylyltransferase family protein [Holosporaceae bacterium]|jgi:CMP-N,N'-diacetyllegionaminic acid synthase|nr:acylneuraminate cytidylyltransferase family protein [Holosporaceae bacterium]